MNPKNLPQPDPKNIKFKTYKDYLENDEKTLLATIAAQNNVRNKHLNRIENNVVFFFWIFIVQFVAALYFMAQLKLL